MKKLFLFFISFVVSLGSSLTLFSPLRAEAASTSSVYINEIKLGGGVDGQPTQYVELVNTSFVQVNMEDWTLEYAKEGFSETNCTNVSWQPSDPSYVTSVTFSSVLPAATESSYGLITLELPMTDNKGGAVHLVNNANTVIDLVGWGESSPCVVGNPANIPSNTKSIERYLDCEGNIFVIGDNSKEFVEQAPTPGTLAGTYISECESDASDACQYLQLSEIVPNPIGSDTGNEFIELYNPTEENIDLNGCYFQVGTSKKILSGVINPGYKSFFGLTLPNSTGGTVMFVTPTTEQIVEYPPGMDDNQSWSYYDGIWQLSNQATPDAENIINLQIVTSSGKGSNLGPCPPGKFRNPETNRCKNIDSGSSLKPCRTDQFRNPETNRCKKIASVSTLKPCNPGQFRNPETNRCKSLAGSTRSLVPCKPGQERNPATNRCRKVGGASTSYVPCKPGYERNPETNRCRKATSASGALTNTAVTEKQASYPAIASISALAAGYGIYEYKQEISEFFKKFARLLTKK